MQQALRVGNEKGNKEVNRVLSVNHYICGPDVSFPDFAAAVRQAGMTSVGITRAALAEMGIEPLARCLGDHGLTVSSLNSAGYFTGPDPDAWERESFELIEAAARLRADVLCVICGGLGAPPMPLADAHARVRAGFKRLAARAAEANVTLGLEPIYPADILTKGCINSCAHGLEIIAPYPSAKLILDLYHSWWDPDFPRILHQNTDKVALIQICNVQIEQDQVTGRNTLADGSLDLSKILPGLLQDGYDGKLEFELFPRDLHGRDPLALARSFPQELAACLKGPARNGL